jgi:transcriptional regulator with GAF, ATPase, and Fis domain
VNCAALPDGLVESELFGHEKGAFSGAVATKEGLFEAAHGGTIFLDEVGELPPLVQAKLLRVLEERRFARVGSAREMEVDVRVVAATNRDLAKESAEGRFRQDLYFRLNGASVWLPPLRDRPRELPILARAFLASACADVRRPLLTLGDGALRALARRSWPGNVRELRNLMGFLAATVTGDRIDEAHLAETPEGGAPRAAVTVTPAAPAASSGTGFRPIAEEVRELERSRMAEALAAASGNRTRAAELISMPLRTFMSKLKQYDLG